MSTKNLFVNIEEVTVLEETNFESMTLMFIILEILFAKFVEYKFRCNFSEEMLSSDTN